jgi:hypothetical protein
LESATIITGTFYRLNAAGTPVILDTDPSNEVGLRDLSHPISSVLLIVFESLGLPAAAMGSYNFVACVFDQASNTIQTQQIIIQTPIRELSSYHILMKFNGG